MNSTKRHIRFDWAIIKLLRSKANFDILEGFLSGDPPGKISTITGLSLSSFSLRYRKALIYTFSSSLLLLPATGYRKKKHL